MNVRERFLKDVKNHELIIENDNGVYRSILCKRKDSYTYYFRIVTYCGGLLITGDMGTWCFERLRDMFDFFREDEINFDYWAEKLVSYDARNKPFVFDDNLFTKEVLECFREYFEEEIEVNPDLLIEFSDWLENNEYTDIEFYRIDRVRQFLDDNDLYHDFMELVYNSGKKKNFHLEWCMNAIVWAIDEYDKLKTKESETDQ